VHNSESEGSMEREYIPQSFYRRLRKLKWNDELLERLATRRETEYWDSCDSSFKIVAMSG
jgi:hypothetical protein